MIQDLMNGINEHYWAPLYEYLKEHSDLIKTFPAFLIEQEQIVFYVGKNHLAIEYFGKEQTNELPESRNVHVIHYDYSESKNNLFEEIVGFKFESTIGADFKLPLPPFSEDLVYPTNKGMDKLIELKWNWIAQDSIMSINGPGFEVEEGKFARIVNGRFFDADENGLKTRHIKWLDFLPLKSTNETADSRELEVSLDRLHALVEFDANYKFPLPPKDDFKFNKLPQINRFLELIGNYNTSETDITSFLERPENKFILTMGILSKEVYSQILCEWQSENRKALKPDFLILRPNGFSDIVEFKLPVLKSKTTVGRHNRETFSAEINSYISQTRVYKEYFEDPNNRKWLEEKHGIRVRYPRRILIAGRRWDFSNDDWKNILDDFRDIEIMTFDDLADGVVSQFYM